MNQAVDGMNDERAFIFTCFGVGLITTLLALMSAAWILMTLEVAVVASLGISWAIYVIVRQAMRIHEKFGLSNARRNGTGQLIYPKIEKLQERHGKKTNWDRSFD